MLAHPRFARSTLVLVALLAAHCSTQIAPGDGGGSDASSDTVVLGDASSDGSMTMNDVVDAARTDVSPGPDALDVSTIDVTGDVTGTDVITVDASDAGTMQSGDCRTDADCFSGRCVEVTPGGFRECFRPADIATDCQNAQMDECACNGTMCPAGEICLRTPAAPYCGGAAFQMYNSCAQDQCASDADCPANTLCVAAGTVDRQVRMCVSASCHRDTDCTARAGGACVPVRDPCCQAETGLFCVYPGGGCRSGSDCPDPNTYCSVDFQSGEAHCVTGFPACPG